MTRKRQLWILIFLAAFTTALQYALQGALATRADISAFPWYFWTSDYILWAARALVEAWIIVFLFSTTAKTRWYSVVLTTMEVMLIILITLTLGPALRSVGMGKSVVDSLSEVNLFGYNAGAALFWAWNMGIAAYAPAMLASVGFAYRMQPTDGDTHTVDAAQLTRYEAELRRKDEDAIRAKGELAQAQLAIASLQEEVASANTQRTEAVTQRDEAHKQVAFALQDIAWMQSLEETTQARLLFLASWRNGLTPKFVSDVLGIAPSTSSRAKATMEQAVNEIIKKWEAEKVQPDGKAGKA